MGTELPSIHKNPFEVEEQTSDNSFTAERMVNVLKDSRFFKDLDAAVLETLPKLGRLKLRIFCCRKCLSYTSYSIKHTYYDLMLSYEDVLYMFYKCSLNSFDLWICVYNISLLGSLNEKDD